MALWAEGTQKCATTWYLQYFIADSEHQKVEENEDKEVRNVERRGVCNAIIKNWGELLLLAEIE